MLAAVPFVPSALVWCRLLGPDPDMLGMSWRPIVFYVACVAMRGMLVAGDWHGAHEAGTGWKDAARIECLSGETMPVVSETRAWGSKHET